MAASGTRSTTNRNARGSSVARRRRKQWLLDTFGDGQRAKCEIGLPGCEGLVTFESLWVDCWPVMRADGGRYVQDNIRPSCGPCNMRHGGQVGQARMRANQKQE